MDPGPPEDPYSSLEAVRHLDSMLSNLRDLLGTLADQIRAPGELSELQRAALELVPAASSIAASIRALIREGYLVSALILFRPLVERIATLCYLEREQEALVLWQQGWPHSSRPPLRRRLAAMLPGGSQPLVDQFVAAVSEYNGLVHGDPAAAQQSLMRRSEGTTLVTEQDYLTPGRAASIAVETGVAIAFLIARTQAIFRASSA